MLRTLVLLLVIATPLLSQDLLVDSIEREFSGTLIEITDTDIIFQIQGETEPVRYPFWAVKRVTLANGRLAFEDGETYVAKPTLPVEARPAEPMPEEPPPEEPLPIEAEPEAPAQPRFDPETGELIPPEPAVPDEESSNKVTSPAEKEAPTPRQSTTVLQGVPQKARSQPTLERRIISKLSIGSGHAKTIAAIDLNGDCIDIVLSIDYGQPSAHKKNIQYGIMLGMISARYYSYQSGLWPSGSPLINDKVDRSMTFVTYYGHQQATFDDLTQLNAYGDFFYGMAMVSWSFSWDKGFYGFKIFAAGGLCLGEGGIRYRGEKGEYWPEGSEKLYPDFFSKHDYYDVSELMYTLGGQLRLGHPRFSILLGAQLTNEPIAGLRPYLSIGILWPF